MHYDQTFIEASDGAGNIKRFFFGPTTQKNRALALMDATTYADGCGYLVLMGRNRLNDYVGPPIWSEPVVIEEL